MWKTGDNARNARNGEQFLNLWEILNIFSVQLQVKNASKDRKNTRK